jgi:hypothetical protein
VKTFGDTSLLELYAALRERGLELEGIHDVALKAGKQHISIQVWKDGRCRLYEVSFGDPLGTTLDNIALDAKKRAPS